MPERKHTPNDIIVEISTCPRCGNNDSDKITWESSEIYDEGESIQGGTCQSCGCYWTEHFERKFVGIGIHNEETGDTPFYRASAPDLAEEVERLRLFAEMVQPILREISDCMWCDTLGEELIAQARTALSALIPPKAVK